MRVNNHEMVIKTNDSSPIPNHKQSLKHDKLSSKRVGSQRFLTENAVI